jgi:glycine/D-amino acid oxidase-like deaminating enzyme
MSLNRSPWLHLLHKTRKVSLLENDVVADIAIVGAGISGISTALFILKYTSLSVAVIDKGRLAHGATGHNAGQVTPEFEKPFPQLAAYFGLEKVCRTVNDVEHSFELVDELFETIGKTTRLHKVIGYDGFSDLSMLERLLVTNSLRVQGGLAPLPLFISNNFQHDENIVELISKPEFENLFMITSSEEVKEKLQTNRDDFMGYTSGQRAIANSARLCEEVVEFCEQVYPDRFSLYEDTSVAKIICKNEEAVLDCGDATITSSKVVLCTNGFHNFTLVNEEGLDLNKAFHTHMTAYRGTMAAYVKKETHDSFCVSYLTEAKQDYMDEEFVYITGRPFKKDEPETLITIGGPGSIVPDHQSYHVALEHSKEDVEFMEEFVKKTLQIKPNDNFDFVWHGLMGYTQSGVRMVGQDPVTKNLYFNLGCNGIGLLQSIYGARRLSKILNNEQVEEGMFDVPYFE